jgi:hypothetical protein
MHANGGAPYPEFTDDVTDLIFADAGEIDAAIAAALMTEEIVPNGPGARRLDRTISDLAVCSVVWVHIWGFPGERRIVKLSYVTPLGRPSYVSRELEEVEVTYTDGMNEVTFPTVRGGSIRWRDTLARLTSPIGTALGWSGLDVLVAFPDLRGGHTYHMQVVAPDGLLLTGIEVDVPKDDVEQHCDGRRAHLYLSNADVQQGERIRFELKAERRGFLNLSLMASALTAGGLWLAQSTAHPAQDNHVNQISASVLLVLPALLAVFVIRQAEHPLVTRLLAGIRGLLLLAGLSSVGAAAALSGIRPAMWQTVSEAWIWYAAIASLSAIGIGIAWLGSFEQIRPFRPTGSGHGPSGYLARLTLCGGLMIGLSVAVRDNLVKLGDAQPVATGLLLTAAVVAATASVAATRFPARLLRVACLVIAAIGVVVAVFTAAAHAGTRNEVALIAILACAATIVLAAGSRLLGDT